MSLSGQNDMESTHVYKSISSKSYIKAKAGDGGHVVSHDYEFEILMSRMNGLSKNVLFFMPIFHLIWFKNELGFRPPLYLKVA